MFDIVRIIAMVWAGYASIKARSGLALMALGLAAYVLGLEVASGITVRNEGPMVPVFALLLVFLGPSGMPRGHLPALPLASAIVRLPTLVHGAAALGWFGLAGVILRRRATVAEHSSQYDETGRLLGATILLAVFETFYVFARVLPALAGGELGSGQM